jgi:hypothetical protein
VITNSGSGEAGFSNATDLRRKAAGSGFGLDVLPDLEGVPCHLRRLQRGFCAAPTGLVLYALLEALDADLELREFEFELRDTIENRRLSGGLSTGSPGCLAFGIGHCHFQYLRYGDERNVT